MGLRGALFFSSDWFKSLILGYAARWPHSNASQLLQSGKRGVMPSRARTVATSRPIATTSSLLTAAVVSLYCSDERIAQRAAAAAFSCSLRFKERVEPRAEQRPL